MTDSTVTVADLRTYFGAGAGDDPTITLNLATAKALVAKECKDGNGVTIDVPVEIINQAVTEVAAELFNRKNAKNGVMQFASADGAAVRIARDPMVAARPILQPFTGFGIA